MFRRSAVLIALVLLGAGLTGVATATPPPADDSPAGAAAARPSPPAEARVIRQVPATGGAAGRPAKPRSVAVLHGRGAGDKDRVWLDGVQTTGSKPAPPKDGQDFLLTLRQIGPDGTPSVSAAGTIFGVGNGLVESITGTAQVRLPQGEYAVSSSQIVDQPDGVGQDAYELTQPVVELTKDSTVVLDARTARQVTVRSSAHPEARSRLLAVGHDRRSADGANSFSRVVMAEPADRLFTAQQGPATEPDELTGHAVAYLIAPGTNTPYLYATADRRAGAFYTGLRRVVKDRDLGIVERSFNATSKRQVMTSLIPTLPGVSRQWVTTVRFDTPATTRMLFEPGYAWETEVSEIEPGPDPNDTWPLEVTQAVDSPTRYAAGRTYRDRWNAAALVPAPAIAERAGDDLQLAFSPHLDADGHGWFTVTPDSAAGKLYRDGKLLAESSDFGYVEVGDVPAAPARYRFETSMTRSVSELSTRIDVTTTFTSAGGDREQFPLRAVRYLPDVDARNTVKRAPVTVLPVQVQGLPGQRLPAVQRLEVQVSGDGGASWRPARVVHDGVDKYRAVFPTPAGQTVSLRAHLVDRAGNSTDQTVVGAYKVR